MADTLFFFKQICCVLYCCSWVWRIRPDSATVAVGGKKMEKFDQFCDVIQSLGMLPLFSGYVISFCKTCTNLCGLSHNCSLHTWADTNISNHCTNTDVIPHWLPTMNYIVFLGASIHTWCNAGRKCSLHRPHVLHLNSWWMWFHQSYSHFLILTFVI